MTIIDGMYVSAWVTKTLVGDEEVIYGPFKTEEEASNWLKQLISGTVEPVYAPTHNRG